MPHRSHLPLAVVYPDEAALTALPLERLRQMLAECDKWFEDIEAFGAAVETPSGRAVFHVLTREDIAAATAAKERLQAAIDRHHDELLSELGFDASKDG